MKREGDFYQMRSGRPFYAKDGIIGIRPNLRVSEGACGPVDTDTLTPSERAELGDFMIAQWFAFKLELPVDRYWDDESILALARAK